MLHVVQGTGWQLRKGRCGGRACVATASRWVCRLAELERGSDERGMAVLRCAPGTGSTRSVANTFIRTSIDVGGPGGWPGGSGSAARRQRGTLAVERLFACREDFAADGRMMAGLLRGPGDAGRAKGSYELVDFLEVFVGLAAPERAWKGGGTPLGPADGRDGGTQCAAQCLR